jgi:hypothetical protein
MEAARARLVVAAAYQSHQLLLGALIVAHDMGALLRHRTSHLRPGGCTGRGWFANTGVAIGHDRYPSLDRNLRQRAAIQNGCTGL